MGVVVVFAEGFEFFERTAEHDADAVYAGFFQVVVEEVVVDNCVVSAAFVSDDTEKADVFGSPVDDHMVYAVCE